MLNIIRFVLHVQEETFLKQKILIGTVFFFITENLLQSREAYFMKRGVISWSFSCDSFSSGGVPSSPPVLGSLRLVTVHFVATQHCVSVLGCFLFMCLGSLPLLSVAP